MKISTLSTLIASLILMTLATGCLETTSTQRIAMYEQAVTQINQASAKIDARFQDVNDLVTAPVWPCRIRTSL